jgi:hypothetical protein
MMRSGGLGLLGWVGRRTANAFEVKVDNTTIAITIKLFVFMPKIYGRRSISCYDASVGFSDAAEAWIATLSCGEGQIKKRWFARRRFQNPAICQCSWIARSAAPWFIDHQPKQRHCRAHLSDHYRASYQHNGHSSAATAIAIRINPQIMDVRLSRRDAAASLSRSNPDFRTRRRLSG